MRGVMECNCIQRGYSLIGKTAILHIVVSGSSPDISNAQITQLVECNIEAIFVTSSNLVLSKKIGL